MTGCEATEWESDSSLRCLVGISMRGSRRTTVTVAVRSGSLTEAMTADLRSVSVARRSNHPGTGSAS
eukprot:1513663-Rhodomonas_salina.1